MQLFRLTDWVAAVALYFYLLVFYAGIEAIVDLNAEVADQIYYIFDKYLNSRSFPVTLSCSGL